MDDLIGSNSSRLPLYELFINAYLPSGDQDIPDWEYSVSGNSFMNSNLGHLFSDTRHIVERRANL
jgi:hypothetical protein